MAVVKTKNRNVQPKACYHNSHIFYKHCRRYNKNTRTEIPQISLCTLHDFVADNASTQKKLAKQFSGGSLRKYLTYEIPYSNSSTNHKIRIRSLSTFYVNYF